MTTFTKLSSSLLIATLALASAPVLAEEPAPATTPAHQPGCACEKGPKHKVMTYLMEKDEAGVPRAVKWAAGAVGAAAMATAIAGGGLVLSTMALAPQCRNSPSSCKAILTQPFTRPNGNQAAANTSLGSSTR